MDFSKATFNLSQMTQTIAIAFMLAGQYYLLKQEIHDNKVFDTAEKQIINYKLHRLEVCCGVAMKPDEVKVPVHE